MLELVGFLTVCYLAYKFIESEQIKLPKIKRKSK